MGVERTLFATAFFTAAAIQVLFSGPLRTVAAILTFAVLLYFAGLATRKDPKMLVFLLHALFGKFRAEYDPCKYKPVSIQRGPHA